jgi:hypothetical protein
VCYNEKTASYSLLPTKQSFLAATFAKRKTALTIRHILVREGLRAIRAARRTIEMINSQTKQAFLKSEKASELRKMLVEMTKDPMYNTRLQGLLDYPDDVRFIEKHMNYMSGFPRMDHMQYISNLKLMTKIVK